MIFTYRFLIQTKNLFFCPPSFFRSSLKPDSETNDYDVSYSFQPARPSYCFNCVRLYHQGGLFQTIALKALKENQKSFLELAEQSFKQLRISSNEDLDSKNLQSKNNSYNSIKSSMLSKKVQLS